MFIRDIRHLTWLANIMMAKKTSRKWKMCIYLIDLDQQIPKETYLLLSIDNLINVTLGFNVLIFMDSY